MNENISQKNISKTEMILHESMTYIGKLCKLNDVDMQTIMNIYSSIAFTLLGRALIALQDSSGDLIRDELIKRLSIEAIESEREHHYLKTMAEIISISNEFPRNDEEDKGENNAKQ